MTIDPRQLFRWLCRVMRCDPAIMEQAPGIDHVTLFGEAGLLAVVGFVSAIAWTNFWWTFIPWPIAMCFGGIAFFFILLMDLAIGAADWRLEGILRRPGERM